jgi:glycosyltransferase involved in cell wall biosynthesis
MYLHNIPAVDYKDPWNIPLEKRLKALERGQRRVAYIYLLPDYLIFRYRVYNMVQALQVSVDGTSAAYFTHQDLASMNRIVDMADVIVICRTQYNQELNRIITRARSKGKTVFFDIDDLVFDVKFIHLILNTHDLEKNDPVTWDNWFAHIGRLSATMQLCDRAITTNEYLAAHLHAYFQEKVCVIPNFLNREQMEISERIYKQKRSSDFSRTDRIHLGYFSGTPSHNRDFDVAADALVKILNNNPQVTLRLVGPMDIRGPLQNFSKQIERYPLQDFLNLQRLIGQVEINLIPLQDNEFTNCKSELKYFEAGIVGTLSLATPTFSFARAIQDGKNGFLARSFEWYEKIQNLLEVVKESDGIEMAEDAMLHSELHYAWYNQAERIESALFSKPIDKLASERPLMISPEPTKIQLIEKAADQTEDLELEHLKYNKLYKEFKEQEKFLLSREAELAEIHSSLAGRAINLYRTVRVSLLPPGSQREKPLRLIRGLISRPRDTINLIKISVRQSLQQPKGRSIKIQDELIKQNYSKDTSKLIVFLIPGLNVVNGGTMSICSLAKVTQSLKAIHKADVLIMTLPGSQLLTKLTLFENPFDIYRFGQLHSYFNDVEELTIHIPEAFVTHFLAMLRKEEKVFLSRIPKLRINILNQNVWLMPQPEIVTQLKKMTVSVTCTTAHSKYCTQQARDYYGIPFHNFSASNLTSYHYLPYQKKEDLMIISHDTHKYKEKVLAKIKGEHPEITIRIIENVPYEEYKHLLERAKWAITFGEGLDGYFVESIRSGAIPFAVYNQDFFTDRFRNLPNVYMSYEEMCNNISQDIRELNTPKLFESLSNRLIELDKQEYDDEKYQDNICRFYTGDYDLP